MTAARFPSEPQFETTKTLMREELGKLFDFNVKPTNQKLDELVARVCFDQPSFQSIQAHWRAISLDGVALPADAAPTLWMLVDIDDDLRPYLHGEAIEEALASESKKHHFYRPWYDAVECQDEEETEPLDADQLKVLRKFYAAEQAFVMMPNTNRYGMPDWANYGFAREALRDHHSLPVSPNFCVDTYDYGDDSGGLTLVKFTRNGG